MWRSPQRPAAPDTEQAAKQDAAVTTDDDWERGGIDGRGDRLGNLQRVRPQGTAVVDAGAGLRPEVVAGVAELDDVDGPQALG